MGYRIKLTSVALILHGDIRKAGANEHCIPVNFVGKPKERAEHLWRKFGNKTSKNMQSGPHLLAVLWESTWAIGNGDANVSSTAGLTKDKAMAICADFDFIPSVSISRIGARLKPPMT